MIVLKRYVYDKYGAIVFDFDNTLFDYEKTEKEALKKVCEYLMIIYTPKLYDAFHKINQLLWSKYEYEHSHDISHIRIECFRILLDSIGVCCTNATIAEVSNLYISESCRGYLIENVETTLETIKKLPILIGIASSGFLHPRIEKLKSSTISNCFDFVMFREDFDALKPDLRFYHSIQKYCEKDNIIYVGDSFESDIKASKQAGFDNIWFDYRNVHASSAQEDFCDHIVTNFKEIANIILQEEL